eukprot:CAMPEP_0115866200 /NCGR_PEP_ID=MMETSP0287-20121206/20125_1 /TAXON_ID=412157 /ORGANISM="Chrysochromulina rotalis, Strain UIO044" /LENGTH=46 /DNA_ID= /DNA_START= /DNA_END= /DNA_ORIENTATION=
MDQGLKGLASGYCKNEEGSVVTARKTAAMEVGVPPAWVWGVGVEET